MALETSDYRNGGEDESIVEWAGCTKKVVDMSNQGSQSGLSRWIEHWEAFENLF